MTRHKHTHTGLVTPSLPQLLLTAMLHLFAMLVSSVASTLQMTRRRLAAECHSDVTPAGLPRETTDTHQETEPAAQHRSSIALMLSSTQSVRSSNHEGVLTTVNHTSPSPSVSLTSSAIHLPLPSRWRQRNEGGVASTAEGGGGGSPRLRGETEGESHTHTGNVNLVHASPAKAGVQSSSDKSARSAPNPFAPSLNPGLRRGCVSKDHANKP